jgi:large subunit ribosomal protein L2
MIKFSQHQKTRLKLLSVKLKRISGRSSGQIVTLRRGGGFQRRYRFVDFKRNVFLETGRVREIVRDSRRSAHLAVVVFGNGVITHILAAEGTRVGQNVYSYTQMSLFEPIFHRNYSSTTVLRTTPSGSILYNLEIVPNTGGKLWSGCRSISSYFKV